MRVYVASKFTNQDEVREAFRLLHKLGHEITHNWTTESYEGKSDDELEHYRLECALGDVRGVQDADAVLVINHANGQGMWTELGMAIAWGKMVFFAYPDRTPARNIFTYLPGVVAYQTLEEAVIALDHFAWLISARHTRPHPEPTSIPPGPRNAP